MHKTRVNPAELAAFKQSRKVWYVGLYIRLSKEDEHLLKHDDSGSINNQVKILRRHFSEIKDGDIYHIVKIFIDDGVSGTTDEKRENFQEMLAYIVAGKINCVAVKDLARSFRNYSDQGYYLDDFFPVITYVLSRYITKRWIAIKPPITCVISPFPYKA